MGQYVALLRGINVGGKNLIKMPELKARFEELGFRNVATYIQSGNVLFESGERSAAKLTQRIEVALSASFNYPASVVLRSRSQLRGIVERAPDGFGTQPSRFLSDVIFLKPPLSAAAAFKVVPTREGVDRVWAGTGVLYTSRLASRATQSRINRIASMPVYQSMTLRSWSTTVKLAQILDGG
jgi:uncharacterized protein (DUF1697 family)